MKDALAIWREKLRFLQYEEAIVVDPAVKFALAKQIDEARRKITDLEATNRVDESTEATKFFADISRIIKYAPVELIGREAETKLLNEAWAKVQNQEVRRPHILTFVALGGEGKTSLVAKWAAELAHQGWPGCDAVFAWSFYSQGTREQTAVSSDLFLKEALTIFGDDTDRQFAARSSGPFEKGQRLARIVGRGRCLLILDGLEPLQYAPTAPTPGELKDQGLAALLKGLATASLGLCVVTTRFSLPDLRAFWRTAAIEVPLPRLSCAAGVDLLQRLGVRKESGSKAQFEQLVEDVKGHALTLTLLGTYLRDAYVGNIRKRDLVKLADADADEQGGHAFRVLDAYVKWFQTGGKTEADNEKGQCAVAVLRLIGLFDRPAGAACLDALLEAPRIPGLTDPLIGLSAAQRNFVIKRLEDAKLLTVNREDSGTLVSLDAHPLVREYFGLYLQQGDEHAAFQAAHGRLFDHLLHFRHQAQSHTLEELEPLYQAIYHGCRAGRHPDALYIFTNRIRRGDEHFSTRTLGAIASDLGALASFFVERWTKPSPRLTVEERAWVLSEAAYTLRANGHPSSAIDAANEALNIYVAHERFGEAIRVAANLVTLYYMSGNFKAGCELAERNLSFAIRSGTTFQQAQRRSHHAHLLHLTGNLWRAKEAFEFADREATQAGSSPLGFGYHGANYTDLLLDFGDVTAALGQSRRILGHSKTDLFYEGLEYLAYSKAIAAAKLGQDEMTFHADRAVNILRRAFQTDFLAMALLSRARLSCAISSHASTQDLAEAVQIATRGGLRFVECETRVFQFRLALKTGDVTRAKETLQRASSLVKSLKYTLRMMELNVLEVQLLLMEGEGAKARTLLERVRTQVEISGYHCLDDDLQQLGVQV